MAASIEEVTKLDQLEVKQTLASARRVLNVHRDWMRRRNPSISPLPPDEPLSFSPEKKTQLERPSSAWDGEEAEAKAATWQVSSSSWSLRNGQEGRDGEFAVAETRGGAGSKGRWRPRSAKVAPAKLPSDDDCPSSSPSQAWNEVSNPLSLPPSRSSSCVAEAESNTKGALKITHDGRSRKGRRSRGSVVPVSMSSNEKDVPGSLQVCTSVPSPLLGFGTTTPPPTLPLGPVEAWSNLSSPEKNSEEEFTTQRSHDSHEKQKSPKVTGRDASLLNTESRRGQTLPDVPEEIDSDSDKENLEQTSSGNERARTTEQVLDNRQSFQKLQSSSTATVVTVIPAPKHLRTSYAKHRSSKVGIEDDLEDPLTDKSRASVHENSSEDTSLSRSGPTSTLGTKLFEIPQPLILPVLPLPDKGFASAKQSTTNLEFLKTPPLMWPREKEESPDVQTSFSGAPLSRSYQPDVATCNNKLVDSVSQNSCDDQLLLEDVNEWIPPENQEQSQPKLLTAKPMVSQTTSSEMKERQVEEKALHSNSHPFHLRKKHKKPHQNSSNTKDSQVAEPSSTPEVCDFSVDESVIKMNVGQKLLNTTAGNHASVGEEFSEALAHQQKNEAEQFPMSKSHATSKPDAFTAVKDMSPKEKKRKGKFKAKSKQADPDKPIAKNTLDKEEKNSTFMEKIKIQQTGLDEKFLTESPSMPLLRVKSTISLFIPDLSSAGKRDRDPPEYSIHRPIGSSVMAPPCPLYGTVQPTDAELARSLQSRKRKRRGTFSQSRATPETSTSQQSSPTQVDQGIQTLVPEDMESSYPQHSRPLSASSAFLSVNSADSFGMVTGVVPDFPLEPGELHFAARAGNHKLVSALLRNGYNINGLDPEGRTPLMYCILPEGEGVHITCANVLIKMGANLDHQAADGSTALHMASYVGAVSLMELLLMNGADPDIRDCDGRLPIHWATKPLSTKPLSLLLKASAADINVADGADMTPLMWAAYNKNSLVLQWLMDRHADSEEKDRDGNTAMHWAVHRKDTKCLRMLLKPDMTYFKDHTGCTVMHWAARKGAAKAMEFILKLRADSVFDIDKKGHTPLHYAMAENKVDVCNLLLDGGADASQCDADGMTPLDYAQLKKHPLAVALMTCHEGSVKDFMRQHHTNQASFLNNESNSFDLSNATNRKKCLSGADDHSVVSESLSMSIHHLNKTTDLESTLERNSLLLSHSSLTLDDDHALSEGSYMGLFTKNINDPPLHYFFWVNHDRGTLCWSRKNNQRNKKEAKVLSVESTPSKLVSSRPDFSPTDLHKHAFWVITNRGVINLLAYNEQAYVCWIKKLQQLGEKQVDEVVDDKERSTDEGRCEEREEKEDCPQASSRADLMLDTALTEHPLTAASSSSTTGFKLEGVEDSTRPRTPPIASSTPIPTSTMHLKSRLDSQPFNPKQLEII